MPRSASPAAASRGNSPWPAGDRCPLPTTRCDGARLPSFPRRADCDPTSRKRPWQRHPRTRGNWRRRPRPAPRPALRPGLRRSAYSRRCWARRRPPHAPWRAGPVTTWLPIRPVPPMTTIFMTMLPGCRRCAGCSNQDETARRDVTCTCLCPSLFRRRPFPPARPLRYESGRRRGRHVSRRPVQAFPSEMRAVPSGPQVLPRRMAHASRQNRASFSLAGSCAG